MFLGVISDDTWPKLFFGQEEEPGEYWGEEGGAQLTLHSIFTDPEADELVSGWEILTREKQIRYLRDAVGEIALDAWMGLYEEAKGRYTREEWQARYESRANEFQYAHLYYCLRKP